MFCNRHLKGVLDMKSLSLSLGSLLIALVTPLPGMAQNGLVPMTMSTGGSEPGTDCTPKDIGPPTLNGVPTEDIKEMMSGDTCETEFEGHFFYCVKIPESTWEPSTRKVTSWEPCWVYDKDDCCYKLMKRRKVTDEPCKIKVTNYKSEKICVRLRVPKSILDKAPQCDEGCSGLPNLKSIEHKTSSAQPASVSSAFRPASSIKSDCCSGSAVTTTTASPARFDRVSAAPKSVVSDSLREQLSNQRKLLAEMSKSSTN